ncbi:MAG: hypothetical protein LC790_01420 [Actinobacteria bacterium]|nr:hypothetical protein [Actinomycetota bacterium]
MIALVSVFAVVLLSLILARVAVVLLVLTGMRVSYKGDLDDASPPVHRTLGW